MSLIIVLWIVFWDKLQLSCLCQHSKFQMQKIQIISTEDVENFSAYCMASYQVWRSIEGLWRCHRSKARFTDGLIIHLHTWCNHLIHARTKHVSWWIFTISSSDGDSVKESKNLFRNLVIAIEGDDPVVLVESGVRPAPWQQPPGIFQHTGRIFEMWKRCWYHQILPHPHSFISHVWPICFSSHFKGLSL